MGLRASKAKYLRATKRFVKDAMARDTAERKVIDGGHWQVGWSCADSLVGNVCR